MVWRIDKNRYGFSICDDTEVIIECKEDIFSLLEKTNDDWIEDDEYEQICYGDLLEERLASFSYIAQYYEDEQLIGTTIHKKKED